MEWAFGGVSLLFGVIGYLLSQKDKRQGEEIAEIKATCRADIENLYRLHHADHEKLSEYKLLVAQNHYTQPQIDFKFQQLDNTMREGFRILSADLKEMTRTLTEHMMAERAARDRE